MLTLGLIVFFAVHVFASLRGLRAKVIARLGEKRYKGIFALITLLGLVLIVLGYNGIGAPLYRPNIWVLGHAHMYMPVVFVLLAAAHMPGYIKKWLKHPMLLGVLIWSLTHLAVNSDADSVQLFGAFAVYSLYAMIVALVAGRTLPNARPVHWKHDIFALIGGVLVFSLVFVLHQWLFGVLPYLPM